jgi:hypothetical protein
LLFVVVLWDMTRQTTIYDFADDDADDDERTRHDTVDDYASTTAT